MLKRELTRAADQIKAVLGRGVLEKLGRETGFVRRKRVVTTVAFVASLLKSLATRKIESLADLLRDFNADHGTKLNYKPYYNRLDSPGFPKLMSSIFEAAMTGMYQRVLKPLSKGPFSDFEDIIIHDGTSFQLHDDLADVFPGRFTTISPAAVELHVTMSVLYDQPIAVIATGDKECERHYAPKAENLKGKLLLADRGYDSTVYMTSVDSAGGRFVIRARRTLDPVVVKVHKRGSRYRDLEGHYLSWVLAKASKKQPLDLDVAWLDENECPRTEFRLILWWNGPQKEWIRLMTNLGREQFTACNILSTYRLRWQIELFFKECKSYANLHMFSTIKSTISEGLFWASLLAAFLKRYFAHTCQRVCGHTWISTRRVAMCSHVVLEPFCRSWLGDFRRLGETLALIFSYLQQNAKRSNLRRERARGRLAFGLEGAGLQKGTS